MHAAVQETPRDQLTLSSVQHAELMGEFVEIYLLQLLFLGVRLFLETFTRITFM